MKIWPGRADNARDGRIAEEAGTVDLPLARDGWSSRCSVAAPFAAAGIALLAGGSDHWRLLPFLMIPPLHRGQRSDGGGRRAGSIISGSFLGIILAAVVLGSGPAALIGALTIVVGWLRCA